MLTRFPQREDPVYPARRLHKWILSLKVSAIAGQVWGAKDEVGL
jgi:hypothetical protein